ncbi:hypothetical protein WMO79_00595 [Micrococcaceae bacterium Sec7.4]
MAKLVVRGRQDRSAEILRSPKEYFEKARQEALREAAEQIESEARETEQVDPKSGRHLLSA